MFGSGFAGMRRDPEAGGVLVKPGGSNCAAIKIIGGVIVSRLPTLKEA